MVWDRFRRAIGLAPTFRRTAGSRFFNLAFGGIIGVISGNYIFAEPLREYWEEEAQRQQQLKGQGQQQEPQK